MTSKENTQATHETTSYHLVVCGAIDKKMGRDGFIFADFMAFCHFFKEHGVGGTFLSCFPIERYMTWLKNTKGINDIKFGKVGPRPGQKPILTYTRMQLVMRESFWQQVGADTLK